MQTVSVWVNSPLAGSSFCQVKHLPRVQIPHKRLNDLGSLRTDRNKSSWTGMFYFFSFSFNLKHKNQVLLLSVLFDDKIWIIALCIWSCWESRRAGLLFQGLRLQERTITTWFPPLLGLTNTSRGFMSWEGSGFTRKGFQRPSWKKKSILGQPLFTREHNT